jgi:hypothetical protein
VRQGSGGFGVSRDSRAATIFASGSGALGQTGQIGGRPRGAVGDDDGQQYELVVLRLAVARLVVLDLLPIADPVGDQNQECLGLGDRVEQAGLPEMPVPQMRLIDEYVSAGQCGLDRLLEGECDGAIGCVITEEDAQGSSYRAGTVVPE